MATGIRSIGGRALGIALLVASAVTAAAGTYERLYVANSRSDHVSVIDVPAFRVVDDLVVGQGPHGLAGGSDGPSEPARALFVTTRASRQVHWINPYTHAIYKSVTVGVNPQNLAATPDMRFLYVPSVDGYYWVLDGETGALVTKIKTGGNPHNTVAAPDGKYVYLAPHDDPPEIWVVDPNDGHAVVGTIPFPGGVRPVAASPDGTRLYANSGSLHGFHVADTTTRKLLFSIIASEPDGVTMPHHGIAVRPDGGEVWTAGHYDHPWSFVFSTASEPPTQVETIAGKGAYWITFSRTGTYGYLSLTREQPDPVTNQYNGMIRVIDTSTYRKVADIVTGLGASPKRTLSLLLSDAGSFQFTADHFTVAEGGVATIAVSRAGLAKGTATVRYATRADAGTAIDGEDYEPAMATLRWGDGDRSTRAFRIQTHADDAIEDTETLTVVIEAATGGAVVSGPHEATLSITDAPLAKGADRDPGARPAPGEGGARSPTPSSYDGNLLF